VTVGDPGHVGVVVAFDEQAGLGEVRGDDGTVVGFHCVAVADGTRRIEPGTAVRYRLAAGLHGRWEAASIEPLGAGIAAAG
jgi:cold shock CspA family protein